MRQGQWAEGRPALERRSELAIWDELLARRPTRWVTTGKLFVSLSLCLFVSKTGTMSLLPGLVRGVNIWQTVGSALSLDAPEMIKWSERRGGGPPLRALYVPGAETPKADIKLVGVFHEYGQDSC